jgi:hypothetical protein
VGIAALISARTIDGKHARRADGKAGNNPHRGIAGTENPAILAQIWGRQGTTKRARECVFHNACYAEAVISPRSLLCDERTGLDR